MEITRRRRKRERERERVRGGERERERTMPRRKELDGLTDSLSGHEELTGTCTRTERRIQQQDKRQADDELTFDDTNRQNDKE